MHESSIEGVDDMAKLADLHEGSLLYNIQLRWVGLEQLLGTGQARSTRVLFLTRQDWERLLHPVAVLGVGTAKT